MKFQELFQLYICRRLTEFSSYPESVVHFYQQLGTSLLLWQASPVGKRLDRDKEARRHSRKTKGHQKSKRKSPEQESKARGIVEAGHVRF